MRVMDRRGRRISRGRARWWLRRRRENAIALFIWTVIILVLMARFVETLGWVWPVLAR